MSELQEEGINAINLPLSPSHYELDPEDTMLGKPLHSQFLLHTFSEGVCFKASVLYTSLCGLKDKWICVLMTQVQSVI